MDNTVKLQEILSNSILVSRIKKMIKEVTFQPDKIIVFQYGMLF